jgi:anaerobic ribonucleoside-triphosphate reductase
MERQELEQINEDIMKVQAKLNDSKLCRGTLDCQTRVSGYYRSISAFNEGKTQEFQERNEYKIS